MDREQDIPFTINAISPSGRQFSFTVVANSLKEALDIAKNRISKEDASVKSVDFTELIKESEK